MTGERLGVWLAAGAAPLAPHVGAMRGRLAGLLGVSLLCGFAEGAVPLLLGPALRGERIGWSLLALALAIAASIGTNVWRHGISQRARCDLALGVRVSLAHQVSSAPRECAARVTPSGVSTLVSTDADRFAAFPVLGVRFLGSACSLVFVASYLLVQSFWLGLIVLVGVPLIMRLNALLAAPLEERQEAQRTSLDMVTERSADIGGGLRVILGLGAAEHFRTSFARASRATRDAGLSVARLEALSLVLSQVVPGLLTVALILFGARLAQNGNIEAVDLVVFYAASTYLVVPLQAFGNLVAARGRAAASAQRLIGLLAVTGPLAGGAAEPLDGDIVDTETTLAIPTSGIFAVRSTVIPGDRQVLRLNGVEHSNAVTWGGRPLSSRAASTRAGTIRAQMAAPYLFAGSVREMLDPHGEAGDAEIWAALRAASAEDVVDRLIHGLDEQVGSNARGFSGGERQRLALARSLVGRAQYMVVHEPTRALDTVTAVAALEGLTALRHGVGTLVLSDDSLVHKVLGGERD